MSDEAWGEPYDEPECGHCEQAHKDYDELEK